MIPKDGSPTPGTSNGWDVFYHSDKKDSGLNILYLYDVLNHRQFLFKFDLNSLHGGPNQSFPIGLSVNDIVRMLRSHAKRHLNHLGQRKLAVMLGSYITKTQSYAISRGLGESPPVSFLVNAYLDQGEHARGGTLRPVIINSGEQIFSPEEIKHQSLVLSKIDKNANVW
jgi:hypothetical protein